MPGRVEHVDGVVFSVAEKEFYVQGLDGILARFEGKRVSITVEEVDDDDA